MPLSEELADRISSPDEEGGPSGITSGRFALLPEEAVLAAGLELLHGAVRLAPQFNPALTYDAALGTLPAAQGWTMSGTSAEAVAAGVYTVNLSAGTGRLATRVAASTQGIARVDGFRLTGVGVEFRAGDDAIVDSGGDRLVLLLNPGPGSGIRDNNGPRVPMDFTVIGVLEYRFSQSAGLVHALYDGQTVMMDSESLGGVGADVRFGSGGLVGAGKEVRLTRVRCVTGAPYLATGPYARVVRSLSAPAVWDLSSLVSREVEGASALRYQYGAGAGALPALNGVDLTLAQLQAQPDPTGANYRLEVRLPSDGSVLQPRAWGGATIDAAAA